MNENDIASLLQKSGMNASAIMRAAKSGDMNALMGALSDSDKKKIEKALNNPAFAKSVLNSRDAQNILTHFGENNNG